MTPPPAPRHAARRGPLRPGASRDALVDLAWATLLAAVTLGPVLLRRGFALRGDMVFVPRQPWKDAWLGLDGSVARFVPGDALLSGLTHLLPGDLVQKLLLLGALVLGGVGAARFAAGRPAVARLAVATLFVWNPWVHERLSIGQWGFVVGYALLPWVARAAGTVRDDPRRGWPTLTLWLGAAALFSPPSALMAVLTTVCVVLARPRVVPLLVTLGTGVVVSLPWILPSLLAPTLGAGALASGGEQFRAFGARGESAAGLLPSLLSLGGIWKSSVVPVERTMALVVLLSCLSTLVALAATRRAAREDPVTVRGLGLLGAVCLLLALVPALGPVAALLDRAAVHLPALGLLRDSHRYLAPAVLALLPGLAEGVTRLRRRAGPGAEGLRVVAVLVALWPVLCLPSTAWGLGGRLEPVRYPGEWSAVAGELGPSTRTVVLPWRGSYRGFDWNAHRAVLDPAPRFLPGEVLVDDRLYVGPVVLGNEDPALAEVTRALDAGDPASSGETAAALAALGVDHVLVEKGNGVDPAGVPAGTVVHDGAGLRLVRLAEPAGRSSAAARSGSRAAVLAGDLVALATCLLAAGCRTRRGVYVTAKSTEPGERN